MKRIERFAFFNKAHIDSLSIQNDVKAIAKKNKLKDVLYCVSEHPTNKLFTIEVFIIK